jgi:hypothetical protein
MTRAAVSVVGLVPHRDRPLARELAQRAADWLRARGIEVRVASGDAEPCGLAEFAVSEE